MNINKKYYLYKNVKLDNTLNAPSNFYLDISLFKTTNSIGYADVVVEKDIESISRQEINPYFIEMDFFEGIQRNKINYGPDLTPKMIQFIRVTRPEISSLFQYDDDIQRWFDEYGKEELPWGEVTIDTIEKSDQTIHNIVSKSTIYPIDINN